MNQRLCDSKVFISQSPRSTMMSRIIENSYGHHLKNLKIILSNENSCTTCSQGKLAPRPSHSKIGLESLLFLQIIQADICGLISPSSGLFHYFMVLIDAFDSSHMFIYYLYTTLYLLDCLHKLLSYLHNFKIIQTMLVSLRLKLLVILQFFGIDIEHPISHNLEGIGRILHQTALADYKNFIVSYSITYFCIWTYYFACYGTNTQRHTTYYQYSSLQLVHGINLIYLICALLAILCKFLRHPPSVLKQDFNDISNFMCILTIYYQMS